MHAQSIVHYNASGREASGNSRSGRTDGLVVSLLGCGRSLSLSLALGGARDHLGCDLLEAELGVVHYEQAAAGFGCHAEFVEDAEEIQPALERAFASGRAACVNVMSDATQPHAPPSKGKPLEGRPEVETEAGGEVALPYYGKRKLGN